MMKMADAMQRPERFGVHIDDAVLDDLRQRLRNTRWPADLENEDWRYGVNAEYLRELCRIWAEDFDWRAAEAAINRFNHYRVRVDGHPIHYMHVPARGPAPIPLILTHGWPWTFWDMHRVAGPLSDPGAHGGDPADAFDLIIPSLPGFGFSTPSPHAGMNFWKTADLWHRLMTEVLGHTKFAAAGGDWGAMLTSQVGHKYAADLYGIHIAHALPPTFFSHERPWDVTAGQMIPPDASPELREAYAAFQRRLAAHVAVQVIEPQTLAYGMHDSPAALLAWLLQRWRGWGDTRHGEAAAFPVEQMLTNATIYWATDSFVSSARFYADAAHHPWTPSHDRMPMVEAPTGITFLGGENPPGTTVANRIVAFRAGPRAHLFNLHHLKAHERGGHFAHFENAPALVDDIRATFRALR